MVSQKWEKCFPNFHRLFDQISNTDRFRGIPGFVASLTEVLVASGPGIGTGFSEEGSLWDWALKPMVMYFREYNNEWILSWNQIIGGGKEILCLRKPWKICKEILIEKKKPRGWGFERDQGDVLQDKEHWRLPWNQQKLEGKCGQIFPHSLQKEATLSTL